MQRRGSVHFAYEGIVNLAPRERDSFEAEKGDLRRGLRRQSGDVAERHQGEGHLTLGINVQQAIDFRVQEAAHHFGWQPQGGADSKQVREQSAVVPAEMAIGAGPIFPSVAPVDAGADDGKRRMRYGRFTAGGFEEDAAIISGPQFSQAEVRGGEVVDAGPKVGEVTANQIKLDLVERSSAGRGAKVDLAA